MLQSMEPPLESMLGAVKFSRQYCLPVVGNKLAWFAYVMLL